MQESLLADLGMQELQVQEAGAAHAGAWKSWRSPCSSRSQSEPTHSPCSRLEELRFKVS